MHSGRVSKRAQGHVQGRVYEAQGLLSGGFAKTLSFTFSHKDIHSHTLSLSISFLLVEAFRWWIADTGGIGCCGTEAMRETWMSACAPTTHTYTVYNIAMGSVMFKHEYFFLIRLPLGAGVYGHLIYTTHI